MLSIRSFVALVLALVAATASGVEPDKLPPPARRAIDFAKDVQPILKTHCVDCHGPDDANGGLRWDVRASALKGGLSGPAIERGNSAGSRLIVAVSGLDEDARMPPEGDLLSAEQVGILRAWIDQGAVWPDELAGAMGDEAEHWSFQPVVRPTLPTVRDSSQAQNSIDYFVLAKLEAAGLSLSPPAQRATLLRRLKFDLLGLPPTPEEQAAFVADDRPDAYERLVDRYLASPHYGERWARHWLDVVRFAESHGFEMNQTRPNAWPYRDYVIEAFNRDTPYEQFIAEQLAGDRLNEDRGTGYLVAGAWDQVKSPDIGLTLQQRADELHDIVSTTGAAFLGLTIGCARCHHHKFDPISQQDYYAIKAVFAGVQHGERAIRPADYKQRQQRASELQSELARIEAELRLFTPLAYTGHTIVMHPDDPSRFTALSPPQGGPVTYEPGNDYGYANDVGAPDRLPTVGRGYVFWPQKLDRPAASYRPQAEGRFRVWLSWGCGWTTHARNTDYVLDLDGELETTDDQTVIATVDQQRRADRSEHIPAKKLWSGFWDAGVHALSPSSVIFLRGSKGDGHVTADLVVLQEVVDDSPAVMPRLRLPVTRQVNVERFAPVPARYVRFTVEATNQYEPCIDELEIFTAEQEPRNLALATLGAKASSSSNFPNATIHKLEHINDGKFGNSHSWISNEPGGGWVQIELPHEAVIDQIVWSRDRPDDGRYSDRLPIRYRIEVATEPDKWQRVAGSDDRLPLGTNVPGGMLWGTTDVKSAVALQTLAEQRRQTMATLVELRRTNNAYLGRFETPEPVHRLHRGDPQQPRELVTPGALANFGPTLALLADTPEHERREALARWIADPRNPLTARVMVNRLWQHHFGRGLVDTPSDFGRNGARPTHPELLDWLADELVVQKGSLKSLHRIMVLSATYRQASTHRKDAAAIDADGRLLWRFPPQRLEAEVLRDTILAVSGNLQHVGGGPGFDLFQPNGNYVKVYTPREEFSPAEWRRMIYQAKPRMQLDNVFGVFDCPDAGQTAPKRTTSITPLQALNLLNSRFIQQQSEIFAKRLEHEATGDARIDRAFALAFGRAPRDSERVAAAKLIETHSLSAFCRAILNANEFLFVY